MIPAENRKELVTYGKESLVDGVNMEWKLCGIMEDLVVQLGACYPIPTTYASQAQLLVMLLKRIGKS